MQFKFVNIHQGQIQVMPKNIRNLFVVLITFVAVVIVGIAIADQGVPAPQVARAGSAMFTSGPISPAQYTSQFVEDSAPHLLVDVRTPAEFASGHLPGAINIPVETITRRLNEIPMDQPVVVYCRSGNRSASAATHLRQAGHTQVLDLGGISNWEAAGYPVVQ